MLHFLSTKRLSTTQRANTTQAAPQLQGNSFKNSKRITAESSKLCIDIDPKTSSGIPKNPNYQNDFEIKELEDSHFILNIL